MVAVIVPLSHFHCEPCQAATQDPIFLNNILRHLTRDCAISIHSSGARYQFFFLISQVP